MPTPEQTETSPVIVDMPLDGVGEKHYVLTYHTAGVGFKPSASTTVYYKVLKEHTVTFDSKGGSGVSSQKILYGSKISPEPAAPTAPSGYTFRNWCIDESCTTAWDFASGTVTSDITLYAKWDPVGGVSYTVQHFQQNINDNNYPTVPSATQTLNGTAGTLTTATANAYAGFEPLPIEQKTITGDGSTVVEVKYKRKRITVTFKLAGGNISGSTDDVPREGKFGATFTMPTNPTKDGYTFNGWTPALSSPPTFPAVNAEYTARWTPKTYTVKFKVDGGHGSLKGTHNGTSQTANGSNEEKFESVPYNSTITFTATPASGYEVDSWTGGATPESTNNKKASLTVRNNATVTVTFKAVGGQSQVVTNWIALRKAVQDASDGDVIEIANDITYDFDSMNSTIKVKKDITVKSTEGNKRTLNAHGNGADGETAGIKIKGVFEVSGGKTLTLENVILTLTEKYAVYVAEDSSLTMKNVTIKDCKTQDNAAGIYFNKGKDLILENCRIEKCKGKGSQSSGAIDIQAPKETVSIKDTAIKNCEANGANSTGGGIHLYNVNNAQCTLENVTVDSCSALSGGGVYAEKGTLTISGGSFTENTATSTAANGGGGAIYNKGSEITITNCIIGGDNDGNMALRGAGIFVSEDAKCILKAGVKIQNNIADGADSSGGGIFVSKNADSTQFGTLTIKGTSDNPVTISENKAEYGGGLYNFGTVTIKNAKIEKNEVPHHGGGMVNAETCTMDSVKLENNKAGSEGGGIYSSKVLTLKDTTVTGNTAKMYGGGIHIGAGSTAFNMSGSSVITADPSKNDVYLADDLYITLTGELTAGEETFARITLNSSGGNGYKAGRVVVKGGVGFNITADYKNKFTITDKLTNPKKWELDFIGSELKLKKK